MTRENAHQTRRLIFIVGFMGSGKTTVARELARLLNCRAIDLDELISGRENRSPGELIEQSGEKEFRRIETEALRQVLNEEHADSEACIIALGGGAWIVPDNRKLIDEHEGLAIWLDASFELCWQRIQASGGRPLAPNELQTRMLYAERRVIYALAEIQFPVDPAKSVAEICRELVEALQIRNS